MKNSLYSDALTHSLEIGWFRCWWFRLGRFWSVGIHVFPLKWTVAVDVFAGRWR